MTSTFKWKRGRERERERREREEGDKTLKVSLFIKCVYYNIRIYYPFSREIKCVKTI